jgi:chemotaxis protein methyltransferase CheR
VSHDFHLCHTHDTFYYQLRDTSRLLGDENPVVTDVEAWRSECAPYADTSSSWIEMIRNASERIASLADIAHVAQPDDVAVVQSSANATDLHPVLEAMRQERFADALLLLQTLPTAVHDSADTMLLRAALLTNAGRLDEAEAACARVLAVDDLNAGAHYVVALCREHAGDTDGALEHDQTAIYLDATFAMPHLHLGLALRRAGSLALARQALSRALGLLGREDASRLLMFGGGFSREALISLCRAELDRAGGEP